MSHACCGIGRDGSLMRSGLPIKSSAGEASSPVIGALRRSR